MLAICLRVIWKVFSQWGEVWQQGLMWAAARATEHKWKPCLRNSESSTGKLYSLFKNMFRWAGVHDYWYEYTQYIPLSASDDISVVSVGDRWIERTVILC